MPEDTLTVEVASFPPHPAYDSLSLHRYNGLLLIANTQKGRAVVAGDSIPARTILETCPVLVINPRENERHICVTNVYNYTYNWPLRSGKHTQAFPLGLGSLFNHSNHTRRCNVGWIRNIDPGTRFDNDGDSFQGNDSITYTTLRAVEAGEELCISYGPKERLTFTDVEEQEGAPNQDLLQYDPDEILKRMTLGIEEGGAVI